MSLILLATTITELLPHQSSACKRDQTRVSKKEGPIFPPKRGSTEIIHFTAMDEYETNPPVSCWEPLLEEVD